jgi:hypothetical protein
MLSIITRSELLRQKENFWNFAHYVGMEDSHGRVRKEIHCWLNREDIGFLMEFKVYKDNYKIAFRPDCRVRMDCDGIWIIKEGKRIYHFEKYESPDLRTEEGVYRLCCAMDAFGCFGEY